MKRLLPLSLALIWFGNSVASAQSIDQIASFLGGGRTTVVLRNYYTDDKLTFDADGRLVSTGTTGFGPSDGRLLVEQVKGEPNRVILTGKRTVPFYDEASGSFKQMKTKRSVKIEINLPAGQRATDAIVPVLNTVFMQEQELDQLKCSTDEAKAFRDRLVRARELDSSPKPKLPDIQSLQDLTQVCFPFGERAYPVGRGISPSHWTHWGRLEYLTGQHTSTEVMILIVDANGNPTSLYLARALGHGADEKIIDSVRKSKFEPAKFQGTPVPVVLTLTLKGFPD